MPKIVSKWYVYMLKCHDGTLYTGITTDLERRVREHNGEGAKGKGAKYTAARRPVELVYSIKALDRSSASVQEYVLRTLPRIEKINLYKIT